jgi:mRNA interferase MazF
MQNRPLARGDIVAAPDFSLEQQGYEIQKSRPALVISPVEYNKKYSIILCCPITSTIKHHPWSVPLPKELGVKGTILVNQLRAFDRVARKFRKIEKLPDDVLQDVLSRLFLLVT